MKTNRGFKSLAVARTDWKLPYKESVCGGEKPAVLTRRKPLWFSLLSTWTNQMLGDENCLCVSGQWAVLLIDR